MPLEFLTVCHIYVNGIPLEQKFVDRLIQLTVDDSLYLPDMFTIHLQDRGLEALRADTFPLGASVKIGIKLPSTVEHPNPPLQVLMIGEVTGIEPDLNNNEHTTLLIRGYDRSHRMNRVRRTVTYQQVTDSDLAQRLASGAGLTCQATSTAIVYPYLIQVNQTDWEFLMERARRIGYRLYVEDRVLHFAPPPAAPPVTSVEWGADLATFRPRLTTVHQVNEVTVRGWDPAAKSAVVGSARQATSPRQIGESRSGGQLAQAAHYIDGVDALVDRQVLTEGEATKVAAALLNELNAGAIEAEGESAGNPGIMAATHVDVTSVGHRFGGKYLVTRALHRYSVGGYSTQFWATTGLGSSTLTELLIAPPPSGRVTTPRYGLLVGIVTNNSDPEQLGRIKVKFPTLGDSIESYWCRLGTIMAGPQRGYATFPEAGDEVVVGFLDGDPNHGVVLGSVWNGSDPLPLPTGQLVTGAATIRRIMRTRIGHVILFDDTPEPGGITIVDKTTNNKIVINTLENTITITADKDIILNAPKGKVSISGQLGVAIQSAAGKVTVDGNLGVDVTTDMKVTIAAKAGLDATVELGKASIKALAGVDIVGEPAPVTIKGLPIMLN